MLIKSAIILSAVQGLTEFLPISSSGHLLLIKAIINTKELIFYDLVIHLGTTAATILIYRREIYIIIKDTITFPFRDNEDRRIILERGTIRLFALIIISTATTGVIGIIFKRELESFYFKPHLVPIFLIANGLLLISTTIVIKLRGEGKIDEKGIKVKHSILIGAMQSLAIIPGISRSGTTISTSLIGGFKNKLAPLYSFLLAIPSIWGATLFEYLGSKRSDILSISPSTYIFSFLISFLVGFIALKILIKSVLKTKLHFYGIYCIVAGIVFLNIFR